jgi:glutathione synthase/RimK-type ligase-like ATP-grasp enzyme
MRGGGGSMVYPDQARYARLAAEKLGLEFTDLDDGNGYLFAIGSGTRRILSGAGWVCSYPVNNSSSYLISRDKAHTKSVLRHAGIATIPGRHFFNTSTYRALRNPGHEAGDAPAFAATTGFPVFCKPNFGARGDYAELIDSPASLADYMKRLPQSYDAFLIEEVVRGDEYRVLVHDDKPVYYALKRPPHLLGDGVHTLAELLDAVNVSLEGTGVSPYPASSITFGGFAPGYRPKDGEAVNLAGRQNLSAHGGVDILDTSVPGPLAGLACQACAALGLRLGAVDMFDISGNRDLSDLVVIEVNGNPTLKALEASGRLDIILDIWVSMIRKMLPG